MKVKWEIKGFSNLLIKNYSSFKMSPNIDFFHFEYFLMANYRQI